MATLVSTGTTATSNGSVTSVTVSSASAVAGNRLVLEICWGDGGTGTSYVLGTPSGWTADANPTSFGNIVTGGYSVFSKIAAGGIESATFNSGSGLGFFSFARITEWSAMGIHDPADASAMVNNNTGGASTGVTVPNTGTLARSTSTVFTGLALFSVSGLANEGVAFSGGSWTTGLSNQNEANVVSLTGLKSVSSNAAVNAVYTWTSDAGIVGYQAEVVVYSDAALTLGLTGTRATNTAGAVGNSRTVPQTGQQASSTSGTLATSLSASLTGQAATFSSGALAGTTTLGLSGLSATFSAGTITVAGSGNITLALTGQPIGTRIGVLGPQMTVGVTGSSSTFSPGSLSALFQLAMAGIPITTSTGQLTTSASIVLLGSQSLVASGLVSPGTTILSSGSSASFASGSTSPSFSIPLNGQIQSAQAGILVPSGGNLLDIPTSPMMLMLCGVRTRKR